MLFSSTFMLFIGYENTAVMESGMSSAPDLSTSGVLHAQVPDGYTLDARHA
jgi:hypothetical protein